MRSTNFFLLVFACLLLASCAKPAVTPDLVPGDECAGTYSGNLTTHVTSPAFDTTFAISLSITKTTDDLVSMSVTIPPNPTTVLDNIAVTGTAYPISLGKTTDFPSGPTGPLTGSLTDNTLTWTLILDPNSSYTYTGTK